MQGFRWEAAHAYYQIVNSKSPALVPEDFVYTLFYGWDIKKRTGGGASNGTGTGERQLNSQEQLQYLQNLILMYMMRNEMRLAPKVLGNPRSTGSQRVEDSAKTHVRTVGQKSKYGELYAALQMFPYVQGLVLYFLAIAYPFACVLVIVPGWHKTIFTWMSFWAWVKLWDLGLALVMSVERTVWAMMGNGTTSKKISSVITSLSDLPLSIGFSYPANATPTFSSAGPAYSTAVPMVCNGSCTGNGASSLGVDFNSLLKMFDRSLALGGSLDLDLVNAYYLFIMVALFIAIPTVTGQLVLGARAGAANIVSSMIGGPSAEAGRAAGAAFSGDMTQKAKSAAGAVGQSAYFKGLRGSAGSVTGAALDAGNKSSFYNMVGTLGNAAREAYGQRENMLGAGYGKQQAQAEMVQAGIQYGTSGAAAIVRGAWAGGGPGGQAGTGGGKNFMADAARKNGLGAGLDAVGNFIAPGGGRLTGGLGTGARGLGAYFNASSAINTGYMNAQGNTADALGSYMGLKPAFGLAQSRLEAASGYQSQIADLNFKRSQVSLGAFEGGGRAAGYGLAQSRLGAEAHFAAENAAWSAKNDYATALTPELSAMGVSPGVLDPGPKPQHFEGAAMTGMLGSDMYQKAHYSDGEGSTFFAQFDGAKNKIEEVMPEHMFYTSMDMGGLKSNDDINIGFWQDGKALDSTLDHLNEKMESIPGSVLDSLGPDASDKDKETKSRDLAMQYLGDHFDNLGMNNYGHAGEESGRGMPPMAKSIGVFQNAVDTAKKVESK